MNTHRTLEPAHEAFIVAAAKFSTTLTSDPRKVKLVSKASEISDLQRIVTEAQLKHEARNEGNTARKWLGKFSKRVTHYGTILDVLVSHHPQYVALAWGAMKFLFVAFTQHEALISCLAKGLAKIADTLPVVDIAAALYPTERMKLALAEIYAVMFRFLVRAQDWHEESRFMRGLHSITRPKELRYDDLLAEIESSSANFRNLVVTAVQAEQRDMHLLLLEMKQMMITHQQINSSAQLNTNIALTDLQFSQILTFLSNLPLENPDKALGSALFLRNRSRRNARATSKAFWLDPKFQAWSTTRTSSLIMVKGDFRSRQDVKDFLTNAISCIREANVPVIWALKAMDSSAGGISVVELLKYLTHQALQQGLPPTERSLALSCARFQTARQEKEWFDILAASLADMKQIYIAVDVEVLAPEVAGAGGGFSLPDAFLKLIDELRKKSPGAVVKIVLISYRSQSLGRVTSENRSRVISVGRPQPKNAGALSRRVGLSVKSQIRRGLA
ncbi:hypothetical protein GGR56DRAFT_433412 [Xylariaceae sp. FL0804]|nr:hypothetical protein GGR56DRAFT_433412 [Xylariaceae sp. FL0804]